MQMYGDLWTTRARSIDVASESANAVWPRFEYMCVCVVCAAEFSIKLRFAAAAAAMCVYLLLSIKFVGAI